MIDLIVNPIAGNGYAKIVGEQAEAYLREKGVAFRLHMTERPGHATELARLAAEAGSDTVMAIGGDGTLTEVASGIQHTKTALGVVPAGTGNDYVKVTKIPRDWKEAVDFILTHPARPINTGTVNDRFFINVCGTGFDVMVLDFAAHAKKYVKGIWPYLYGVIRAIKAFKPYNMRITVDKNTVLDGEYTICTIANGRWIGGGIPIAPLADVTDGMFDLMLVDKVPKWKIPFYLPALLSGKLYRRRISHRYLTADCQLSSPGMRLNLDGEIIPVDSVHFVCETDAMLLHW